MHLHRLNWRSVAGERREWLGRQVQSRPAQRSRAFSCRRSLFFFFLFATSSNLPLSSYSNKTIICSNKKWEKPQGSFTRYTEAREPHPIRRVNKVKSAGFLSPCHPEGFARDASEVFFFFLTAGGGISLRFPSGVRAKIRGNVLPRLLNICVLGRVLSESCYFCLGHSAGDEARKKHRLQVSS